MPVYDWYGLHSRVDGIDQGLILPDFPVPNYDQVNYASLASDDDVDLPVVIEKADLIIMTQACDIKNDKVKNITLCRVYPLNEYLIQTHLGSTKAKELIDGLSSDRVLNMALLDRPNVNPYDDSFEDFLLVKFDETINYPKELVEQRIGVEQGSILKLQPPYREALSQDFGLFFMRVGAPIDRQRAYIDYYKDFLEPGGTGA